MIDEFGEFDYLKKAAEKYGRFELVHQFREFVQQVTAEQLVELASIYCEIARKEDSARISRWIDRCVRERDRTPYEELRLSHSVGQLLNVFQYLADENISPFNAHEVTYLQESKRLDWSKLPNRLNYLVQPAEKYGRLGSEAEMISFLDGATPEDLENLAATAQRVRMNGDYPTILDWLRQYPEDEHPEAFALFNIFGIMDHAGLDFGG